MNKKSASLVFLTLLSALSLLWQGCATNPSEMVPTDAVVIKTQPKTVAVGTVSGNWPPLVHGEDFKQALEDSLLRYRSFSRVTKANSGEDYRIEATLLEMKQPFAGFSFNIKSIIHWRLINVRTGQVVWDQTISRHFSGQAFLAAHREQLSNEGSIRENIKAALQEIGQLSL
jgi:hypothetical protein